MKTAEDILRKHFDEDWPDDKGIRGTDEEWETFKTEQNVFITSMIAAMEEYAEQKLNIAHILQAEASDGAQGAAVASGAVEKSVCDGCEDIAGFYLGTTCPKCKRPFRQVK